jgi:hypothetical protein
MVSSDALVLLVKVVLRGEAVLSNDTLDTAVYSFQLTTSDLGLYFNKSLRILDPPHDGTQAAKAGVQPNWLITHVGGAAVVSKDEYQAALLSARKRHSKHLLITFSRTCVREYELALSSRLQAEHGPALSGLRLVVRHSCAKVEAKAKSASISSEPGSPTEPQKVRSLSMLGMAAAQKQEKDQVFAVGAAANDSIVCEMARDFNISKTLKGESVRAIISAGTC